MDDWTFDGGALSLDLANTLRDRRLDEPRETLVDAPALDRWFAAADVPPAREKARGKDLSRARRARDAIYRVLGPGQAYRPHDVRVLNEAAALAPTPRLRTAGGSLTSALRVVTPAERLALVAADAVQRVSTGAAALVKECTHEQCGLLFLDTSRGGRRQWCSMKRCGNRTKVARFEANRRA